MFRVGTASLAVATVGVVLPFLLGFLYWAYVLHPASGGSGDLITTAIFIGATLTATSVGITARVLSDLDQMSSQEARIIIGAAVIDDVLGLVILSVVSGLAAGAALAPLGILRIFIVAVGFLVVAVLVGRFVAPRLFDLVVRMRVRYVLLVFSIAFALGLAAVAALAGSALIIGAFAAGLILSGTNQFDTIEREVRPVASIFAPIFFVSVGASVNLRLLDPTQERAAGLLGVAGVLIVLAVVGKLAAGWAAPWVKFRRLVVGVGMIPRGEVGLIFADIGRRAGILNEAVFGAILLMVMATTFIAPPGLKLLFGSRSDEP
jgi:Kef-type K+ transport system membrane component KefB